MRNLKKLVALIVTVALMLTLAIPAFAATPTDVKGTDYEGAVTRLTALGVITGYPNGDFGPNDSITRAQSAAVLVRALGYESIAESAKGVTKFSDVSASYWGAGYINLAVSLGLIKGYGDGKFGPDDKVTYDQIVTMIVRALGMDYAAELKGGFPTGYLLQAKVIKFTDGVKGVSGANATRGIVAQLVDNAKDKDIYEQTTVGSSQTYQPSGDTFLTKLGMTPVKDVVVTLTPKTGGDADKLTAGGTAYDVVAGAFDVESVLGKEVTLWKNSDGKVVLAQSTAGTDVVVKSISSITVTAGVYTKIKVKDAADVEKEYNIPAGTKATDNLKAADAQATFNKINAVSGSTDKFDLTLTVDGDNVIFAKALLFAAPVKIDAPVVNTVAKSIKVGTFYIKKGDKDAKNLVIVKDGAVVDYTALAKDDVIMVAANPGSDDTVADDDYFYITATNKTVSGKLASAKPSAAAATSVKIGDTSYDVNQFGTGTMNVASNLDTDVKATLDPNGKVFAIDSTTSTSADKYGVILATSYDNSLGDEVYKARVLTASGDKVNYNVTSDALKADIAAAAGHNVAGVLVKYYINSDGNLATIEDAGAGDTGTTDVSKLKFHNTYVKSDVVVFVPDGSSYKAIKWTEIKDDATGAVATSTFTDSGEYTAILFSSYTANSTTGNYAYTTDKTAIKDSKYVLDLVNKSGAASVTTAANVYADAGNAISYTLAADGTIDTLSVLAKAGVAADQKLVISEVGSNRIKVTNTTTDVSTYYYLTDDSVIVYDKDLDGGSGVDKLTKADLYKDMEVEVYLNADGDIAVLTIGVM